MFIMRAQILWKCVARLFADAALVRSADPAHSKKFAATGVAAEPESITEGEPKTSPRSNLLLFLSQPTRAGMEAPALQEFAAASGGPAWIVNTASQSPEIQLASALTSIAQSLGRSYGIGVIVPQLTKPDTTLKVEVERPPDASVSAVQDCRTESSSRRQREPAKTPVQM
jgi:hypothetical protein